MKRIITVIMLVMTMLLVPVTKAEQISETYNYTDVKEGDILEAPFEYEVDEEDIDLEDGLVYVGFDGEVHRFKALKDLNSVTIRLFASKESGSSETEHESGNSNDHGKPGTGGSGEPKWDTLDLGKNSWHVDDDLGEYLYAIRIKVNDYQDHDYIIVQDVSENLTEPQGLEVRKLRPKEGGGVDTLPGEADYEVLEGSEPGTFEIKIKVDKLDKGEYMMYDIVYYMSKLDPTKPRDNQYKVYTVEEWEIIISGGEGSGEEKPQEPEVVTPEEPDTEEPDVEEPPVETPEETPVEDSKETDVPKDESKPIKVPQVSSAVKAPELPRTGDITNIRTFLALATVVTGFLLLSRRRRR